MANLFDYLNEYGKKSFRECPFNEIDNFIFSQLSYLDYSYVVTEDATVSITEASAKFFEINPSIKSLGLILPPDIVNLFRKLPLYDRFAEVVLSDYVNTITNDEQFSAVTFHLPTGYSCVAFRGTDDSIVGWKEDFMLCYRSVPAQSEAVAYLNQIGKKYPSPMYVCGHSKGGNLAVYASAKCNVSVKKLIQKVYNNDGPGFCDDFYESEDYKGIAYKVIDIVPQSSIVGMLLEHSQEYQIVQSDYKGIFQHNVFSWQVDGTKPLLVDDRTKESYFFDQSLKEALKQMDLEEKHRFVEVLFKIIEDAEIKNLIEVPAKGFDLVYHAFRIDKETRKLLRITAGKFLSGSGRVIHGAIKRNRIKFMKKIRMKLR